jgi:hypothetical protein
VRGDTQTRVLERNEVIGRRLPVWGAFWVVKYRANLVGRHLATQREGGILRRSSWVGAAAGRR